MYRALLFFAAAVLIAACVPLESKQASISSADEALRAVVEMAEDKGWTVTSAAATSVIARAPRTDDDVEVIYTVTTDPKGSRLTLNVHRVIGGFGQKYSNDLRYYIDFFDDLEAYL